jgi:hypothetical protein
MPAPVTVTSQAIGHGQDDDADHDDDERAGQFGDAGPGRLR